jgi:hypothetical protein
MITIKLVFIKDESISFIFPEYFIYLNWKAILNAVLEKIRWFTVDKFS